MTVQTPPYQLAHILTVDDDQDIGIALKDLLEGEGYHVEMAETGREALQWVQNHQFDAVLLDVGLPDLDGLSVLRKMVDGNPHLPVILLTAFTSLDKSADPLDFRKAFAYITKPYNGDHLKATLQRALKVKSLAASADQAHRKLNASEDRFRSVVQAATDAIILSDAQGTIVSWNRAAQHLFGYSEEEIVGRPLSHIMPTRYRQAHLRGLQRMKDTGESHMMGKPVELAGLRKDGSEFPLELSLGTWTTETERFFCGFIRDITDRKKSEEALRVSEERFRRLVETANVIPWEADCSTWQMTYVGPQASTILGFPAQDWYCENFWEDHLHPDDSEWVVRTCRENSYHQRNFSLEYRMLGADGRIVWVQDLVTVLVDEADRPKLLQGLMVNVTERKSAQRVLENARHEMETILSSLPVSIFILDQNHRVVYANSLACQHFQESDANIAGKPIQELLPFKAPQWNRLVGNVFNPTSEKKSGEEEAEFERNDRLYRYCVFPLPFKDDGQHKIGLMVWDFTENKHLQDQIFQTEKLSSLGTLISGMAHEMASPMQALVGISELLCDDPHPEMVKELIRDLRRISLHVAAVLKDFMAYARPASRDQESKLDFHEQLLHAVKMVQRGPYFGKVEVAQEFHPVPLFLARRSEIEQVFVNLIGNAVQAMKGKGRLTLATSAEEKFLTIRITDTGGGIPSEVINKIFDPFFSTKKQGEGTGLGLSIVQKIVTKYGGTIHVASSPGTGTTFTIQFPLISGENNEGDSGHSSE